MCGYVTHRLLRLKQGFLTLPAGQRIEDFVRGEEAQVTVPVATQGHSSTLRTVADAWLASRRAGREANTLKTDEIHIRRLLESLGSGRQAGDIDLAAMQKHVDRRAKAGISRATIGAEMTTLRAIVRWGVQAGMLAAELPGRGVVLPKDDEPREFMTRAEIERLIAAGGLDEDEIELLWDGLYLETEEVAALLEHVRRAEGPPWLYPMVCVAAATGSRRSELCRMKKTDVDLAGRAIVIRERKRDANRRTIRRVPMSDDLHAVLVSWLSIHPGGPPLFAAAGVVPHSRHRSATVGHVNGEKRPTTVAGRAASVRPRERIPGPTPVSPDQATDHFIRVRRGSEWEVVRGWHIFRHSLASNLAAAGVDQRIVDAIMGHVSESMARRYRHLGIDVARRAIEAAFGGVATPSAAGEKRGPEAGTDTTR